MAWARPDDHLVRTAGLHRRLHRGGCSRRRTLPSTRRRLGGSRAPGRGGGAPLRVAGAGPAGGPGVRRVRGRAGGGAVRRPRLRAAQHRAHVRRVRAPGIRPADCRHLAHVARGLGCLPPSRRRPGDVRWLRVSLGLLCALTLVVVVSALHRMQVYQEAYGFTQARLVVDVFEGWLGVVVLAVAISGLVRWGTWVPRFALVTGVVGLLGIAAINPDAWIARHNIERYEETGKVDVTSCRRSPTTPYPSWRRPFPSRCGPGSTTARPLTTTGSHGTSAAGVRLAPRPLTRSPRRWRPAAAAILSPT